MLKALALVVAGLLSVAGPTAAAERSLIELIGYSEDGRYFAFEEFNGPHDFGNAAAKISIIDLDTNRETPGSPFAVEGGEDAKLFPTRAEARALAATQLVRLGITAAAELVSMVGDGVAGANGLALRFGSPGSSGDGRVYGDRLLTLETFETGDDRDPPCPDAKSRGKGLALAVADAGTSHEIYRDKMVPKSRGCPIDYRLYGVVLPYNGDIGRAVVIVSVYTPGWEGPDRHFIAIPVGK